MLSLFFWEIYQVYKKDIKKACNKVTYRDLKNGEWLRKKGVGQNKKKKEKIEKKKEQKRGGIQSLRELGSDDWNKKWSAQEGTVLL